jgi:hypothetical protein
MPSMAIPAPFPLHLRQWRPLLARPDRVFREAMEAKNHGAALGCFNAQAKLAKVL